LLEIITRIGKIKYFDKGHCSTIAESTKRILEEYILPNTTEKMEWQPFRDKHLWCLEVDDLYKANKHNIDLLFKWCKSGPMARENTSHV